MLLAAALAAGCAVGPMVLPLVASEPAPATRPIPSDSAASGDETLQSLEQQAKANPKDASYPTQLGDLCFQRAERTHDYLMYARAEAGFKDALSRDAKHIPAMLGLGAVHLGQYRFREALAMADQVLALQPDMREAVGLRGDILFQSGDRARPVYEKLFEAKPDLQAHLRMADLLFAEGDAQAAIETLQAALEAETAAAELPVTKVRCLVRLGELHFRLGKWEQADQWYSKALELQADDPDALDHRAELLAAHGEFEKALVASAQAIKLAPRPEFLQARGDIYAAMGDHAKAFEFHDQALAAYLDAARAGHAPSYRRLAVMYCDVDSLRDPAEALRWARNDLQMTRAIASYDAMAWAQYHNGQFQEAAASMDKTLRDQSADAFVLHRAGLIYARAGDPVKGRRYLRRAADLNPKFNEFHFRR
jgi:tetratricopeptide (TPR) repeat protein